MRVLLIKEKNSIQRYEVTEEEYPLMLRSVQLTVEGHNDPSKPEEWWTWCEEVVEGTEV